ncbi:hypothetical protein E2C05_04485 [Paracraurococcus ruber]|uniref:Uncharacterized protein n=1 Tax=Paracraurococcus ruber TaxID=77675 RepID=A0ABS1CY20_9PROT|nr:hypothetical protein [Paracraurococcus ruber]TDG33222.1 hypothetical protein E2C05_04485 [Paracraurococcus ruber]
MPRCARGRARVLFLDRRPGFAWHRGMMLPGARLRCSWIKDLMTPVAPASRLGFLSCLAERRRLPGGGLWRPGSGGRRGAGDPGPRRYAAGTHLDPPACRGRQEAEARGAARLCRPLRQALCWSPGRPRPRHSAAFRQGLASPVPSGATRRDPSPIAEGPAAPGDAGSGHAKPPQASQRGRSMFHITGKPKSITPRSSARHTAGLRNWPLSGKVTFSIARRCSSAARALRFAGSPSAA